MEKITRSKALPIGSVSGSFSFEDMANFAVWIKDNFSNEIAGAFARRSDGNLYWDEQVGDLVKLWCENYR
jgi:hypothetical protein